MMHEGEGKHRITINLAILPKNVEFIYIVLCAWKDSNLKDIVTPTVRLLAANSN